MNNQTAVEILPIKTPDRAPLIFFFSPWKCASYPPTHINFFFYPGECSVDSGLKYRVHSKLGVMFSVRHGPPREPGPWSSPEAA